MAGYLASLLTGWPHGSYMSLRVTVHACRSSAPRLMSPHRRRTARRLWISILSTASRSRRRQQNANSQSNSNSSSRSRRAAQTALQVSTAPVAPAAASCADTVEQEGVQCPGKCKTGGVFRHATSLAGEAVAAADGAAAADAVARRTRAQQSLIDCSLEELEALLQLDAEDARAKEDADYEAFIQVRNIGKG